MGPAAGRPLCDLPKKPYFFLVAFFFFFRRAFFLVDALRLEPLRLAAFLFAAIVTS